jgi:membrane protease YdiL (CAAX protease family)
MTSHMTSKTLKPFFLWSFAIAWAITVPIAWQVQAKVPLGIPVALGWLIGLVPGAVAIALSRRDEGVRVFLRRALHLRAPAWAWLLALLLPFALLLARWAWSTVTGATPPKLHVSGGIAVFYVVWLLFAFGEELGWRAYALPRMLDRGFWRGATLLGLAWCVWHYPKLYNSPYLPGLIESLPLVAKFSLQIILANYLICWLYLRGGRTAVIPALFHAGFNTVATIYPMAAMDTAMTALIAACVAVVAILDRRGIAGLPMGFPEKVRRCDVR